MITDPTTLYLLHIIYLVVTFARTAIAIPDQVVNPLNSAARLHVPSGRTLATRQRSLP
ncbi:hypothetical protein ABID12_004056 [Martelella mangrovi]|uniref:Uncharacterized protein n=1 Tax=Martelella mangrovi TaxID=1397477 RepID=A0ABV2IGP4_9HYPH